MDLVRYVIAFLICWVCGPIFFGLLDSSQGETGTSDFPAMQACFWCGLSFLWVLVAIVPLAMFGEWLSDKNKYHPVLVYVALAGLFFVLWFTFVIMIALVFGVLDESTVRLAMTYGFTNLIWGSSFWILVRTQRYFFQRMEWVQ